MLIFMVILRIFATVTVVAVTLPATIFVWFRLVLFMATAIVLFLNVFWDWPVRLRSRVFPAPVPVSSLSFSIIPNKPSPPPMPTCIQGKWKEAKSTHTWRIAVLNGVNEDEQRLRANRDDGLQIIYRYQGTGLWQSEGTVSIPIRRSGMMKFKREIVTLELPEEKSCSELVTNDSNIVLKRIK
jgi:hypothetical protein